MIPILPCKVSTTLNWTVSLKNSFSIPYFSFCYQKSKINNKIKLFLKKKNQKQKLKKKNVSIQFTHTWVACCFAQDLLINIEKG